VNFYDNAQETERAAEVLFNAGLYRQMITVLAFNLLGDGLRDALNPKLKRR